MTMNKYNEEFGKIKSAFEMKDYADFLIAEATLKIFKKEADEKLKVFKNRYSHVVSLKDYSLIEISAFDDYMTSLLEDFTEDFGILEDRLAPVKAVMDYVRESVLIGFNLKDLDITHGAVKNSWYDYIKYMRLNDRHDLTQKSFEDFEENMEFLFGGFKY